MVDAIFEAMTLARWKDLCIDTADPGRMGPFWGAALGLTVKALDDGDYALTGPTPEHLVWINTVPDPLTTKQRIHLDLKAASIAEYEALGAGRADPSAEFAWTVMRDPEGGELCLFVKDDPPIQRLYEIVVDTADPAAQARWWAEAFGAKAVHDRMGYSYIEDIPGAPMESIDFVPVPEPKTVKNRIHWDVHGSVPALAAAGATVLRAADDVTSWTVMADPEGNEFCVFS